MNTNYYDRSKYVRKIIPLITDEDRHACERMLTKNTELCHGIYESPYLQKVLESSDYILFYHTVGNIEHIVAFACVEVKSRMIDILLLCTIPNKEQYGRMIAHAVFNFALMKGVKKMYVAPRTPELRKTFLKYGFVHHVGIIDYDEVLVNHITVQKYTVVSNTRKAYRFRRNRNSARKTLKLNNNLSNITE